MVESLPVPALHAADVENALVRFRGPVWQVPPAYSAIKQEGEALYARARRGEAVSADARQVTFHRIDLVDFRPPDRIQLAIHCSAGAYIRSLAYDLGRSMNTAATLVGLRREAVGEFDLADAITLEQIEAGRWRRADRHTAAETRRQAAAAPGSAPGRGAPPPCARPAPAACVCRLPNRLHDQPAACASARRGGQPGRCHALPASATRLIRSGIYSGVESRKMAQLRHIHAYVP